MRKKMERLSMKGLSMKSKNRHKAAILSFLQRNKWTKANVVPYNDFKEEFLKSASKVIEVFRFADFYLVGDGDFSYRKRLESLVNCLIDCKASL